MNLLKATGWVSLVTSIILIVMLFSVSSDIYKGPKVYPNHAHTTIYIDRNFYDYEQDIIVSAALKWSTATNHIIDYDVVLLPTHEKISPINSLIFVKISPDFPEIMLMDEEKHGKTLGHYSVQYGLPTIYLIPDRLDEDNYETVVLHELGHSLGLAHIESEEGRNTLMYPSVDLGSNHITDKDLVNLCKLYHCNAAKLKH